MHDFKCTTGEKHKTTQNLMSSFSEEEKIQNNPAGEAEVGIKSFHATKSNRVLQPPHKKLELWSDVTVLRGMCSPQGCLSGATCHTSTMVPSGAPFTCMPLRVMHFWLNLLLCERALQLFCSLLLSRPQLCPPLFFSSVAEPIPRGSGVLRAFISKSVEQLLLVSLHIYHLKDARSATHFSCNTEQTWEAGGGG